MQLKLTKKQQEIVNHVMELEKENNCTIYFKYEKYSEKIHPIKIDNIEETHINYTSFPHICTHGVAATMQRKEILITEKLVGDLKLCKLNHEIILSA